MEHNGARIINEETLNLMIKNQLPNGVEFTDHLENLRIGMEIQ